MTEPVAAWFAKYQEGFFLDKRAEGLSENTVIDYKRQFGYFAEWLGDRGVPTTAQLKAYLAWLRQRPNDNRPKETLSPKTVVNGYIAIRSFFRWYAEVAEVPNPTIGIPTPKAPVVVIDPLSEGEIKAILKACEYSKAIQRPGQKAFAMKLSMGVRDRAIVLVLLDTGIRATEFCELKVGDVDLSDGRVIVRRGKGGKGRAVYLGKAARRALWRYLNKRAPRPSDPLFLTTRETAFDRDRLRHLLVHLGERSGVDLYPHKLRHTFATVFLANGGNLLSLQRLLGHSSLEMVRRYAAIAEADLARAHETGSPADKWRL